MLRSRYDLPLERDATGRFLPWITALMVYLAVLAVAGGLSVSGFAQRWRTGLTGTLTVQLPAPHGRAADAQPAQIATAVDILRATPGVASARALSGAEIDALLAPWLGPGDLTRDLPVPALIDVAVDAPLDLPALRARLDQAAPGTTIDDHQAWLNQLLSLTRGLEALAGAIVVMVGAAAGVTVVFAARAGLAIHAPVIELLHVIGAPDRYVARQFERHILTLAVRGSALGAGLAVATLVGLALLLAGGSSLMPAFALTPVDCLALALVPVALTLVAATTARTTVLRALARLP